MIGRWLASISFLLALGLPAAAAGALDFFKRPKSEAQVKKLIETAKHDADEKKRRAAIAELRDADPRAHPDVISALIASLQKDSSAAVRQDAADAIGSYKLVYPLAGLALEAASELDSTKAVRDTALQALWEYHLAGYRSPRGANGIAGQTAEPPIARPLAIHRPPVSAAAALDVPIPLSMPAVRLPKPTPSPVLPPPRAKSLFDGPILARRPVLDSFAMLKSALPSFNKPESSEPVSTPEPPIAQPRMAVVAPEPRAVVHVLQVPHVVTPQPYDLPPVAEPPGELAPVMKPMLLPQEPPVGPRIRSSR